jgi:hypothetical protein
LSDARIHIGIRHGLPMRVMDETGTDFTFEYEGGVISCVAGRIRMV